MMKNFIFYSLFLSLLFVMPFPKKTQAQNKKESGNRVESGNESRRCSYDFASDYNDVILQCELNADLTLFAPTVEEYKEKLNQCKDLILQFKEKYPSLSCTATIKVGRNEREAIITTGAFDKTLESFNEFLGGLEEKDNKRRYCSYNFILDYNYAVSQCRRLKMMAAHSTLEEREETANQCRNLILEFKEKHPSISCIAVNAEELNERELTITTGSLDGILKGLNKFLGVPEEE